MNEDPDNIDVEYHNTWIPEGDISEYEERPPNKKSGEIVDPLDLLTGESRKRWKKKFCKGDNKR